MATLRDGGHIVRDVEAGKKIAFATIVGGHRHVGVGESDIDAAWALLLAMGYHPH